MALNLEGPLRFFVYSMTLYAQVLSVFFIKIYLESLTWMFYSPKFTSNVRWKFTNPLLIHIPKIIHKIDSTSSHLRMRLKLLKAELLGLGCNNRVTITYNLATKTKSLISFFSGSISLIFNILVLIEGTKIWNDYNWHTVHTPYFMIRVEVKNFYHTLLESLLMSNCIRFAIIWQWCLKRVNVASDSRRKPFWSRFITTLFRKILILLPT